jgi:hypothetical protein
MRQVRVGVDDIEDGFSVRAGFECRDTVTTEDHLGEEFPYREVLWFPRVCQQVSAINRLTLVRSPGSPQHRQEYLLPPRVGRAE